MTAKESKPAYAVQTLEQAEAVHVAYALELYDWNQTQTATALGINRRTLSRMIERHGLERKDPAPEVTAPDALRIVQCPNCSSELDTIVTVENNTIACTECGHTFQIGGPANAEFKSADA